MSNPAALLYDIFTGWRAANTTQTAMVARGLNGSGAQQGIDEHVLAMKYLAQIKETLDRMEQSEARVGSFQKYTRIWAKVIIAYPHGWQQGNANQVFTGGALEMLDALAGFLEDRLPHLTVDELTRATSWLDQVVTALAADEDLPTDVRDYIFKLVQNAKLCIEEYEVRGQVDLESALAHLWGGLKAAEGHTSEKYRGRWQELLRDLMMPTAAGILANAPGWLLLGT